MLMEMPFVKTLVTAPFRWTQSGKTGVCKAFQCEFDFRSPRAGKKIRSQWKKERKRAGDYNVVWTGQTPRYAYVNTLQKSQLFSNPFMEQLHLSKITNIIKWITRVGLQDLAWRQLFCCRSTGEWGHRRSKLHGKLVAKASGCLALQTEDSEGQMFRNVLSHMCGS